MELILAIFLFCVAASLFLGVLAAIWGIIVWLVRKIPSADMSRDD